MSKTITVQLYGHPGNNAVVRMPDRQNPGVVIQADTLGALADDARRLANAVKASGASAMIADEAAALADRLQEIFARLEAEMTHAGEMLKR
ncbi:MAG TPA: hypothetical protein VN692_11960 [Steroidobacteraceae bacterium]|nr:hypothetical protein [Steroidobacteraceae bacterium]